MAVNSDPSELLQLLACPVCRRTIAAGFASIVCTGCGRTFELDGRVPVMAADGVAEEPSSIVARVHYGILGNPQVYDFQQRIGGAGHVTSHVGDVLAEFKGGRLLDIGAGTGMVGALLSPDTRYVWFDNDRLKLRGLLSKPLDCIAVLGDGAALPFVDRVADWTTMIEVSHHLPDEVLRACLREIARVTRDRFLFVDAVRGDHLRSNLMWQVDLGRFPRREEVLLDALGESFDVESVVRFRVHHDHVLYLCVPRRSGSVTT